jgi:hypothetical protein
MNMHNALIMYSTHSLTETNEKHSGNMDKKNERGKGVTSSERYRVRRVHVGGGRTCAGSATAATARPRWPSALTRQGRRVHSTGARRTADGRGTPAAWRSSVLVAGTKDTFVLVEVGVTSACVDVEAG